MSPTCLKFSPTQPWMGPAFSGVETHVWSLRCSEEAGGDTTGLLLGHHFRRRPNLWRRNKEEGKLVSPLADISRLAQLGNPTSSTSRQADIRVREKNRLSVARCYRSDSVWQHKRGKGGSITLSGSPSNTSIFSSEERLSLADHLGFKMRLIIMANDDGVSDWAAKYVIKRINEYKPSATKYV